MAAARGGHARVLRLLRSRGFAWDENTTWAAARGAHINILRWLLLNGCACDESAGDAAARANSIAALELLRKHKAPLNPSVCAVAAASHGHTRVLNWLRVSGLLPRLDAGVYRAAYETGHLDAMELLVSFGET